jgi:hypothetical protein
MNDLVSAKSTLPVVGDILCGTYGYEACIANFYKVTKVTKSSVRIAYLSANNKYNQGGMNWTSEPILDVINEDTEPLLRRFNSHHNSYYVKLNSYTTLSKWSGYPVQCYNHH